MGNLTINYRHHPLHIVVSSYRCPVEKVLRLFIVKLSSKATLSETPLDYLIHCAVLLCKFGKMLHFLHVYTT